MKNRLRRTTGKSLFRQWNRKFPYLTRSDGGTDACDALT
jgi:hypothetical protein